MIQQARLSTTRTCSDEFKINSIYCTCWRWAIQEILRWHKKVMCNPNVFLAEKVKLWKYLSRIVCDVFFLNFFPFLCIPLTITLYNFDTNIKALLEKHKFSHTHNAHAMNTQTDFHGNSTMESQSVEPPYTQAELKSNT